MTQDLLIEIGTEELPPLSLRALASALCHSITAQLTEKGIGYGADSVFCTPRRLALVLADVEVRQPDRTAVRRGPAFGAAFGADGRPSKALEGFARSCGVEVSNLTREESEKGEWVVFRSVEAGQATSLLIAEIVGLALADLPIAKRMRWGSGEAEFVRPVHWVCIILGGDVVPGQVLGIAAGRDTRGHRFHAPGALAIPSASLYPRLLRERGFVEPCFDRRRTLIREQIEVIARTHGVTADIPTGLLDEVTALVEWPRAILGSFDDTFLSVPAEVLIETMQKNQKYFPVRDDKGRLVAKFVAISNIESNDLAQVIQGNERVIRPRFADAKFFWEQDLRQPLAAYFDRLESVVFQEKLGSVGDRSRRIAALAQSIATAIGESPRLAERAALLAKCDLVTAMVGEFPSLQGIMGRYYAEHSAEVPLVCMAIEEQYHPRYAGDALPTGRCGLVLALADRLDLLVGAFGIGHRPTGAKDPYALRRASIAVVRLLVETSLDLDVASLLEAAQSGFPPGILNPNTCGDVLAYIFGRLEGYYQEQAIPSDSVLAVITAGGTRFAQLDRRIRAIQSFRSLPAALALAAANKRIANILSKNPNPYDPEVTPNPVLFVDDAERLLWARIHALQEVTAPLLIEQDFAGVLTHLAELRDDVDLFFDRVMVMTDDMPLRANRVLILLRLRALFLQVADIGVLQHAS